MSRSHSCLPPKNENGIHLTEHQPTHLAVVDMEVGDPRFDFLDETLDFSRRAWCGSFGFWGSTGAPGIHRHFGLGASP